MWRLGYHIVLASRILRNYDYVQLSVTASTLLPKAPTTSEPFIWIRMASCRFAVPSGSLERVKDVREFHLIVRMVEISQAIRRGNGDMSADLSLGAAERSKQVHTVDWLLLPVIQKAPATWVYTVLSMVNYLLRRPLSPDIWCKTRKSPLAIDKRKFLSFQGWLILFSTQGRKWGGSFMPASIENGFPAPRSQCKFFFFQKTRAHKSRSALLLLAGTNSPAPYHLTMGQRDGSTRAHDISQNSSLFIRVTHLNKY